MGNAPRFIIGKCSRESMPDSEAQFSEMTYLIYMLKEPTVENVTIIPGGR